MSHVCLTLHAQELFVLLILLQISLSQLLTYPLFLSPQFANLSSLSFCFKLKFCI